MRFRYIPFLAFTWAVCLGAGPQAEKPFTCPTAISDPATDSHPIIVETSPFLGSKVYRPDDNEKHLSVVILHGSEGGSAGLTDEQAKGLAARGFAALALCYFDCLRSPGEPETTLINVESTKVLDAVDWFRHQSFSNGKVVVYGFSRGAELTLVAGSLDGGARLPDALIAHTPSDVFNRPFNWSWQSKMCWVCKKNNCSDNSPDSDFKWNPKCGPDDPELVDYSKSAWLIHGAHVPTSTRIKIEKFKKPILITVGLKDELWPVDQTRRIEATLKKSHDASEIYYFPGEKHYFQDEPEETCRKELVLNFLRKVNSVE